MKIALFLSCVLGGSLLYSYPTKESSTVLTYKTSKAKKHASLPIAPVRIVIDKSNYELYVYDSKGWYATYPVVFGNSSLADKRMEGDRCTPEGNFRITAKRPHGKWSRFMAIDYPTHENLEKFKQLVQRGEIPRSAKPAGGIGIHGTWPHEDFAIDRYNNWTNGCIALKREDVEELYSYIGVGTPVTIRR